MKVKIKSQSKKPKLVKEMNKKSDKELLDYIAKEIKKENGLEKYLLKLTKITLGRN
jgi:hypothetical protein